MLQIERKGNGFKITAKEPGFDRFSAEAKDLDEVAEALRHYYGDKRHVAPVEHCPFCRDDKATA